MNAEMLRQCVGRWGLNWDSLTPERMELIEERIKARCGVEHDWTKLYAVVVDSYWAAPSIKEILDKCEALGFMRREPEPLAIRQQAQAWVDEMIEFAKCGMQHKLTPEKQRLMKNVLGFDHYSLLHGHADPRYSHKRWVDQVETYLERKRRDPDSIALPSGEKSPLGLGGLVKELK